jgi:hypothetical protein
VDHVVEMVRHVYRGRVAFHAGEDELAPGITVHRIGGHTPGIQSVVVQTARGPVVLASDASHFYDNVERHAPYPIVHDVGHMLDRESAGAPGCAERELLPVPPRRWRIRPPILTTQEGYSLSGFFTRERLSDHLGDANRLI